jgi:PAS domain S-box-containing protein
MSEERFRSLLQFSSDAINILDREGNITFESSLDGKISGFSLLQIIGSPAIKYVHEDDRQIFEKAFMEVVNNPAKTVKLEFRSITTAGRIVHVESIFANHLENPQIRGIVMNSRDITARRMADIKEKSFREAQAFLSCTALDFLSMSSEENLYQYILNRLSEIARNAILLAVRFDEAESMLRIEYIKGIDSFREKVRDILGTDPEHIQVKVDEDFRSELIYNSKHLYTFRNGLFEVFNRQLPMSVTKKIEEQLCITEAYGMALMRQGKFYGNILIFMMNDQLVDEKPTIETFLYQASIALHRRQLEQELIKAKERAVESEKIKTAFLANMSHEIRTPMNGILGFAQLLSSENITKEDIREYTQVIDSNGKLLISLIDDIIDISKLETGHLKMNSDSIHLNQFLDDIYSSVFTDALRAEKKDVNFHCVKAFDDDACTIETDQVRLRQIINNLIANAIKFTEKGSIEFGYGLKDLNTLLFFVKDSGIGIPPDKKQIIFDRFVQADLSATRKYGGSGLGLAISKGLVEMMGGTIWVESIADKGSSFYFTHPYTPMSDQKPSASSVEDNKSFNGKEKTVLVVEDDKFSFKYLEAILKRYQISILHAVNGLEAVEMCRQHPEIDLVLMDIQLPNLSGYDATRQIRETYKNLPIIAQTANAFDEDRIKCLDAGCNEYLAKPVNLSTLLNILAKYLF